MFNGLPSTKFWENKIFKLVIYTKENEAFKNCFLISHDTSLN